MPAASAVEVFWPATGRTQTIGGLQPRRHYRIREGAMAATRLNRPAFGIAGKSSRREESR